MRINCSDYSRDISEVCSNEFFNGLDCTRFKHTCADFVFLHSRSISKIVISSITAPPQVSIECIIIRILNLVKSCVCFLCEVVGVIRVEYAKLCARSVEPIGSHGISQRFLPKRRHPPSRKYVLISFHPDDKSIAKQLFVTLYVCLEPFVCRPIMMEANYELQEVMLRQIASADMFVPVITENYQNTFSKDINLQISTAVQLSEKKGRFWIVPIVMTQITDTRVLHMTERYIPFVCFDVENLLERTDDICWLFRMIMETREVTI